MMVPLAYNVRSLFVRKTTTFATAGGIALVVFPKLAGHGPRLFEGLSRLIDLELIDVTEFASGARAERYRPVGSS